jgi:hypothetical protein
VTEFQLVGVFLIGMSLCLLGGAWIVRHHTRGIATNGHRTEATVVSQTYVTGDTGSYWQANLTYTDFRGVTHTKAMPVAGQLDADTAIVIYDPRKPSRAVMEHSLGSRSTAARWPFLLIGAMVVLGIVFIVTGWGDTL